MEIYIILLLWSIISAFICFRKNNTLNDKNIKMIYCFMNYIPLSLVLGLRDIKVGTDTAMYHEIFYEIGRNNMQWSYMNERGIEIGYVILNKIIYIIFGNSYVFIFIVSLILIAGFMRFFYQYSYNIWLTVFLFIGLFYYCETFNTIRQSIACMIIFNGYVFLRNGNVIKWIGTVLIATCFHNTAIIFLLFSLLYRINKIKVFIISFIGIGFYLILAYGRDFLVELFINNKYGYYLVSNENSMGADILRILLFVFVMFFIYIRRNNYNRYQKKDSIIWSIFLLYASIMTLAKYQVEIFYRMVQYFSPYITVLLPLLLFNLKIKKYICYLVVLVMIPIVMYYLLQKNLNLQYDVFF